MITKAFEIRDRATFIPVIAVKLEPACERDRYLLSRAGYGVSSLKQSEYVLLAQINGGFGRVSSDPHDWGSSARTYQVAHDYIIKHFDALESGAVIDVEFILGETTEAKLSEAETAPL
jgi:hypothetical protein